MASYLKWESRMTKRPGVKALLFFHDIAMRQQKKGRQTWGFCIFFCKKYCFDNARPLAKRHFTISPFLVNGRQQGRLSEAMNNVVQAGRDCALPNAKWPLRQYHEELLFGMIFYGNITSVL